MTRSAATRGEERMHVGVQSPAATPQREIAGLVGALPLAPVEPGWPADTRLTSAALEQATALLGADAVAWALAEARAAFGDVAETFSHDDALPARAIAWCLQSTLLDLLIGCVSGAPGTLSVDYVPEMARDAARRDISFAQVITSMRDVERRWVDALLGAGDRSLSTQSHAYVVQLAATVVDREISRFVASYLAERETLLESHVTNRRSLAEALLAGEALDPVEIRDVLAVDIDRVHIGAVLSWAGVPCGQDLRRIVRSLSSSGGVSVLALPADGRYWLWLTAAPDGVAQAGQQVARTLAAFPQLRCTLGDPAPGPDGFRRSHVQARDLAALRDSGTVDLGGDPSSRLLSWREHALVALLSLDPERAQWFRQATLGPLAGGTAAAAEQRATLNAYLGFGHSLLKVAEHLKVHRNTVAYRISRIEEALGAPVAGREAELQCALLLSGEPDVRARPR